MIFDNHSITQGFGASIITSRQRTCLAAFADMLDFSSREEPVVRAHETCQTDNQQTIRRREEDMEYKRLGHSGLKVSRIILGCMGFGDPFRNPPLKAGRACEDERKDE